MMAGVLVIAIFVFLAVFLSLLIWEKKKEVEAEVEPEKTICSRCGSDQRPCNAKKQEVAEATPLREIKKEGTKSLLVD